MNARVATVLSTEEQIYRERTGVSHDHYVESRRYMPGGDSRSPLFYPPYPAVLEEGHGCSLYDADGNALLDFTSNHSSLVLGYGHPHVMDAVQRQLVKGTCFPGSTGPQVTMARVLCERLPSLEHVRFTNSGTEASMNALRAARAFTGRDAIAKIEGGYNGTIDATMVSTHPSASQGGDVKRPAPVASSRGLTADTVSNVVVLPFNDVDAAERVLEQEHERLAAVIVEPVLASAGMIPAEPDYLQMLRRVTQRFGIVLIFDEVVSLRVAYGGAQAFYGVVPDLTCLGKLIGGGFPLGAFGGRRDIMALFDPTQGRPPVPHPGSYNANPISLAAGVATLEMLTADAIALLNDRGEAMREGIREAFDEAGCPVQLTGLGSLFALHLTDQPVTCYRDTLRANAALRHEIFLGLFNEGVLIDPRGVGTVSLAIGKPEIDAFHRALRVVLHRVVGGATRSMRGDL